MTGLTLRQTDVIWAFLQACRMSSSRLVVTLTFFCNRLMAREQGKGMGEEHMNMAHMRKEAIWREVLADAQLLTGQGDMLPDGL